MKAAVPWMGFGVSEVGGTVTLGRKKDTIKKHDRTRSYNQQISFLVNHTTMTYMYMYKDSLFFMTMHIQKVLDNQITKSKNTK